MSHSREANRHLVEMGTNKNEVLEEPGSHEWHFSYPSPDEDQSKSKEEGWNGAAAGERVRLGSEGRSKRPQENLEYNSRGDRGLRVGKAARRRDNR